MPGTKHLRKNPVIAYLPDEFQKPYPFAPTVAVDVGPVLDKIVDMLHCHVSQFYEWLPYNTQTLDQVPKTDAERRAWLAKQLQDTAAQAGQSLSRRSSSAAMACAARARPSNSRKAFEPCEYGSPLDQTAAKRLFACCAARHVHESPTATLLDSRPHPGRPCRHRHGWLSHH